MDGAFRAGADGHLVIDEDLRRAFDYFLTATGEEPPATIRARIDAAIDAALPQPAAGEAHDLLAGYLAYRDAGRALGAHPGESLEQRLQEIRLLRERFLDEPAASALFALEVPSSSAAAAARAAAVLPLEVQRKEADLVAAGAGPEDVQALRQSAFGPEAADRLAALDRDRADFQRRLALYRAGSGRAEELFSPAELIRVQAIERATPR